MKHPPILYFKSTKLDLNKDERVAITITANNYEQPDKLNSSRTNTFNIPFTRNNVKAVGALMAGERTRAQYLKQKSTLLLAGSFSDSGSLYIFEGQGQEFQGAFISGIADFFDDLKDHSLWCLFKTAFDNTRTGYIAEMNNDYTDGFTTALASFSTLDPDASIININRLYPFPYFHALLSDIASFAGWTIGTDGLLADDFFRKVAVAYNGEAYNEQLYFSYTSLEWAITAGTSPGNYLTIDGTQNADQGYRMMGLVENSRFDAVLGKYKMSSDDCGGKYFQFTAHIEITKDSGHYDLDVRIAAYTGTTYLYTLAQYSSGDQTVPTHIDLALETGWTDEKGVTIVVQAKANVGLNFAFSAINFRFCDGRDGNTDLIWGADTVMPYASLPNMKMTEFVKDVCKQFGAIPKVDGLAKTISFIKFEDMATDYASGGNWSGKLDGSQFIRKEWKYGEYGKINTASYDNDKELPVGFGQGQLNISNANLQETYEWLKLNFSASLTVPFAGNLVNFAYIPVYDADGNKQKLKPRCVHIVNEDDATIAIADGSGSTDVTIYNVAAFYRRGDANSLSFGNDNGLLLAYHARFALMIGRMEKATAFFALNANDIAGLNLFAPVFISQQYGNIALQGWYIVQEVKEWDGQQTVQVEVLKLNFE